MGLVGPMGQNHAGSALPFREGKGYGMEGAQREPFIMRYPNQANPRKKTIDVPVMPSIFLPTIAEITGCPFHLNHRRQSAWVPFSGERRGEPTRSLFLLL